MATGEIQNANPTILNLAQLPSRRRRNAGRAKGGPECRFDDILSMKHSSVPWGREPPSLSSWPSEDDDGYDAGFVEEPIDEQEIYDLISTISDPEHAALTLGQLSVVNLPDIHITPAPSATQDPNTLVRVLVEVTPTINHCSLITVIGLAVRARLERILPPNYRIDVQVKEGTHATSNSVTKQLSDKERVAAALENPQLRRTVGDMLLTCK